MSEFWKIILLGVLEGVTEWLPISSTAHLLLFDRLLRLQTSEAFKEMFFVVIQLGAILAVMVLFFRKMTPWQWESGKAEPSSSTRKKLCWKKEVLILWTKVFTACIPTAILGFLFDDVLEEYFGTRGSIAAALIFYGILFLWMEKKRKGKEKGILLEEITYSQACFIGLCQALAMIPGTSRSGVTILGALFLGISRTAGAEFTFFLAVPTMFGASALKLVKFGWHFTKPELWYLFLGMASAYLVSILVIRFLMNYIKNHDFQIFGWYRIILGGLLLFL